jgi:hypothetical protein
LCAGSTRSRGEITPDEYERWQQAMKHPDWKTFLYFVTAVWGQKSAPAGSSTCRLLRSEPKFKKALKARAKKRTGRAACETLVRKRYGPKQADKSTKHR